MENYFDSADGKLHFVSYSEVVREKPVLVFLSGMTCHAHYWDEVAPTFAEDYAVYALDWRGHGDSFHANSYGYDGYLADLKAFLTQVVIESRPLIMVGHSLGGYVGLLYASQPDNILTKLVACDVKTSSTPQEHEGGRKAALKPHPSYASLEEVAARLKAGMPDGSASDTRYLEIARFGARENSDGSFSLKYDRKLLDFEPVDPYPFVGSISIPVLIISGERSMIMTGEQAHQLTEAIPNASQVEIKGAGHHVFLDNPTKFVEVVKKFL